jgi:hypothetical protein
MDCQNEGINDNTLCLLGLARFVRVDNRKIKSARHSSPFAVLWKEGLTRRTVQLFVQYRLRTTAALNYNDAHLDARSRSSACIPR